MADPLSTDLDDLTMILMLSAFQSFLLFAWHKMTCRKHVATFYFIFLRLVDWNQHLSTEHARSALGPKGLQGTLGSEKSVPAMSMVQEVAVQDWLIMVLESGRSIFVRQRPLKGETLGGNMDLRLPIKHDINWVTC